MDMSSNRTQYDITTKSRSNGNEGGDPNKKLINSGDGKAFIKNREEKL